MGLVGWEWDFAAPVSFPELNLANPLDGAPRISFPGLFSLYLAIAR